MKLTLSSPAGNFSFETTKRETVIGRGDAADWIISSDKLSRSHCVVYVIKDKDGGPERLLVKDSDSKNGITINGKRINTEEMTPIAEDSIVILANTYILTFGQHIRPEMIDLPGNARPEARPRPLAKKNSRIKDDDSGMPVISRSHSGLFSRLVKFALLMATALCGAIYFFIFK